MSPRMLKLALWLALFALLPVPLLFPEQGLVPTLRIAFLATMLGAVTIVDGAPGVMAIFALLPLLQAVGYSLLLWLVASLLLRATKGLAPRSQALLVAGIAVLLLGLSSFEIYRTPLSSSGPYSNLAGILD